MKHAKVWLVICSLCFIYSCSDDFVTPEETGNVPSGVHQQTFKIMFHQRTESSLGATMATPRWLGEGGLCGLELEQDVSRNMFKTQDCISRIRDLKVLRVEFYLDKNLNGPFEIFAVETVNRNGEGINKKEILKFSEMTCENNRCFIDVDNFSYMSNINRLKEIYKEGLFEYYFQGEYNPKYTPLQFVLGFHTPDIKDIEFNVTIQVEY